MEIRSMVVAALPLLAPAAIAQAQVSRVFVSVTGNDANVCSDIATPCRTFAGGITQVDPQGEVIVIASGSYAGGTITKSVKINVASGVVAFSGLPIFVNPGAGGTVVLRGLTLKSALGSDTGILHQSGALFVENTVVDGWDYGLTAQTGAEQLFVKRSAFRNQAVAGLNTQAGGSLVFAVDDSFLENNGYAGLQVLAGTGRVSNTAMTGNGAYGALVSNAGTAVTFQRCESSSNGLGGLAASSSSVLRLSESTLVRNGIGLDNVSDSATVESFGNNVIRGNVGGNNIVGTVATVSLQ
jgi:hypothetical protein